MEHTPSQYGFSSTCDPFDQYDPAPKHYALADRLGGIPLILVKRGRCCCHQLRVKCQNFQRALLAADRPREGPRIAPELADSIHKGLM